MGANIGIHVAPDGSVDHAEVMAALESSGQHTSEAVAAVRLMKSGPKGRVARVDVERALERAECKASLEGKSSGDAVRIDDDWGDDEDDWGVDDDDGDGDWGDEEQNSGDGKTKAKAVESTTAPTPPLVKTCKGAFQILDEEWLRHEVDTRVNDVCEQLGVARGAAIHMLRAYKWYVKSVVNAVLDDPAEARRRTGITHPTCSQKSSGRVRCTMYSGAGTAMASSSSAASSTRSRKRHLSTPTTQLESECQSMYESGVPLQTAIRSLRKKNKVPAIIRAFQKAQSKAAGASGNGESGSGDQDMSLCERGQGWVDAKDAYMLSCGHWRCLDCCKGAVQADLASGRETLLARCTAATSAPGRKRGVCGERIPREIFVNAVGEAQVKARYDLWVLRNFAVTRVDIKGCPAPGCKLFVRQLGASDHAVCKCGHQFCFQCLEAPHTPAPCTQFKDFRERGRSDYQQRLWFQMHTMTCPSCNVRIEKNRACLHMTCTCGHEWCWACRKPWGQAKHNYYNCPDYKKATAAVDLERAQKRAAWELRKYQYYQHLISACKKDVVEAAQIKKKWSDASLDISVLGFVEDAIDGYVKAKNLLQNLYVVAFYFKGAATIWTCTGCNERVGVGEKKCPNCEKERTMTTTKSTDKRKELFEFQLRTLVDITTQLRERLAGEWMGWACEKCTFENENGSDTCKLCRHEPSSRAAASVNVKLAEAAFQSGKRRIMSLRNSVATMSKNISSDIDAGNYAECILKEPDDSVRGWFCVRCQRMNNFDRRVCASSLCFSCQAHGERDCLRCNPRR